MDVLSQAIIVTWLLPQLPFPTHGRRRGVAPAEVATPLAGQPHDTLGLEAVFGELCQVWQEAALGLPGLFPNAAKACAGTSLHQACARRDSEVNLPRNRRSAAWQTDDDTPLDPELYRRRQVSEQLNAWLDGFKTLLVRVETGLHTWRAFHGWAFAGLLLRRSARAPTF